MRWGAHLILLALAGCVFWTKSGPPDDADFARVAEVRDFDGVYRNRGVAGDGDATPTEVFLSGLIWPGEMKLDHPGVETVDFRAVDDGVVRVRALGSDGAVRRESTFVEGRDFVLERGRVRIRRESALLSHSPDDPLVGPRVEQIVLGLDELGQGRSRSTFRGAGLIYLILPVAISTTDEVRFERVAE